MKSTTSSLRAKIFMAGSRRTMADGEWSSCYLAAFRVPLPPVVHLQFFKNGLLQINARHAGQLEEIESHVGELARERGGVRRAVPLVMLQHLGGLDGERGGEVARRLRPRAVRRVPAFGGDEAVHFLSQVVNVHTVISLAPAPSPS